MIASPARRGELALNAKAHNCSELASAAAYLAQQMGLMAHVVGNDSHEYAVLGDIPEAGLPKHLEDWPAHLVICDVYADVVCPAQDYVVGLTKKLNQWTDDQKLLHDGRRWFKPDDPAMISEVAHGEREIYHH